jgi:tetratricopeptide (TPR) repeat protein
MHGSKMAAFLVSFLLAIPTAQAARRDAKDSLERAARKACLSGDVGKGVDILTDLYIDTKDAVYIFNQGRCYEQNLRYQEALARFREYLVKAPDLSAKERAEVEKHIAKCESYIAGGNPDSSKSLAPEPAKPTVIEPAKPAPPAPEVPLVTPQPAPMAEINQTTSQSDTGSGLRTAGVITAAFGGAALVTGVVFNLQVNSLAHDLEVEGKYSRNKESRRATYQTLGWVAYGVGAACVATGTALYFLGRSRQSSPESSVAFVPVFTPGNVGAALEGSF